MESRERIAALQQKRARTPVAKGKQRQGQGAKGLTIAQSGDDEEDDDEWISSGSGAATPQNVELEDTSSATDKNMMSPHADLTNGVADRLKNGVADRLTNGVEELTTPRAEVQLELTCVDTARPDSSPTSRVQTQGQAQPPVVRIQPQTTPSSPESPSPTPTEPSEQMPVRHTRSEAPSPSDLRHKPTPKRHPLIRHSSNYAGSKVEMPPHPLIRGKSLQGSALKPAALVPLYVNNESAQAQLLAFPSSRSASTTYQSFYQSPSETSTVSGDRLPSRKGSISSLHSIATLPAPSRLNSSRTKGDRTQTLSSISTSSSSAALTALNMLPATSRPGTPPMIVRFPYSTKRDAHDAYHHLLPPPYLASYMSLSNKYNPLLDSYERVMRAKNTKPTR